jgi:hypothetical protein
MSTYSFHAKTRVSERCSLSLTNLNSIIKNDRFTKLGMDLNKKNVCHYMFYSMKDSNFFILIIDEKKSEVVTILYGAGHHQWKIDTNLFYIVRDTEVAYCLENNINFPKNHIFESTLLKISNIIPNCMEKKWNIKFKEVLIEIEKNIKNETKYSKVINLKSKKILNDMLYKPINDYISTMHLEKIKKFKKLLKNKAISLPKHDPFHFIFKHYEKLVHKCLNESKNNIIEETNN